MRESSDLPTCDPASCMMMNDACNDSTFAARNSLCFLYHIEHEIRGEEKVAVLSFLISYQNKFEWFRPELAPLAAPTLGVSFSASLE